VILQKGAKGLEADSMPEELYSVIVNWNLKQDTIACIHSLLTTGLDLDHILVVDNGSSDGSVDALITHFGDHLGILDLGENRGYAGGLNAGIERLILLGAKWCLLLNNDVVVAPDFLAKAIEVIHNMDYLAIISPLVYFFDDPKRIWSAGDRLIPGTLLTQGVAKGSLDHGQLPAILPVDFVNGSAMLIHSDIFQQIGLFPTEQFMYGEEVDFCWRAKLAGIPRLVATQVHLWHKVSRTSSMVLEKNHYWRIYNQIRFYRNYARKIQVPFLVAFTFWRSLWIAINAYILGKKDKSFIPMIAWRDGWFYPLRAISEK
jgi:GT2 family glycosyltransferase